MKVYRRLRSWQEKFISRNPAIIYYRSPSRPLAEEWRSRSLASFVRHLMRIEREERLSLITGLKCWYRKQIFLSQCTSVGDGLRVGPDPIRVFRGTTAKLEIGEGVVIYTPCEFVITTHVFQGSAIKIGPNTRVGKNCAIRAALYVEIGEGCLIAPWVRIADYNGHPIQPGDGRIGAPTPPDEVGPVIIGDNVWIGENAFIQKGVTIGRDSVVGANSVVTRNVPEGTVVMGIPARVATRLADLERVEKAVVKASTSSSSRDER